MAEAKHQDLDRSRIDRLRFCFSELHADAMLVSHPANIRYLCGFSGSAGLLLVEPSESHPIYRQPLYVPSPGRSLRRARTDRQERTVAGCRRNLRARKGQRLQSPIRPDTLTVAQKEALQATSGERRPLGEGCQRGRKAARR